MLTKRTTTVSLLDAEIKSALGLLKDLDKNTPEYGAMLERVAKLSKLKTDERPQRISPDNALLVGANLFGILAIIQHERVAIITSKAFGLIVKPRG